MNIKQIEYFFTHDYPILSLRATGRCLSASTVRPKKINAKVNNTYEYYQNVLSSVNRAIAKLKNTKTHPYKALIIERYAKQTKPKDIPLIIGLNSNYTNKRRKEALVLFATEYNKQADKYNLKFKFEE